MNAHQFVAVSALGVFVGLGSAHAGTPHHPAPQGYEQHGDGRQGQDAAGHFFAETALDAVDRRVDKKHRPPGRAAEGQDPGEAQAGLPPKTRHEAQRVR